MATNYTRGRAFEYLAKKELELQGYTVLRTAGSHGPYDIIAFRGAEPVRCIQIKRIATPAGRKRLLATFSGYQNGTRQDELWVREGGKWHKNPEDPLDNSPT